MASLLEVGTGFHPELTGRENIFLNGAILGMHKAEIKQKFDEIVAFSETERFLDTPVKRYSSGMRVRLAFSVAAHIEPEILVVDEVLAVGDSQFQKKCLGKMDEISKEGRTVLFVSHNMAAINALCNTGIWLDEGEIQQEGPAENVVALYLSSGAEAEGERKWNAIDEAPGNDRVRLRAVRVLNTDNNISYSLDIRSSFFVEIEYEVLSSISGLRIGFWLLTSDGMVIFAAGDNEDDNWDTLQRQPGTYSSICEVPGLLLKSGKYLLTVGADVPGIETIFLQEGILAFHIEQTQISGAMVHGAENLPGVICPSLKWRICRKSETISSNNRLVEKDGKSCIN
jgi:lipopolysaccharide transport system ATP-binding protein